MRLLALALLAVALPAAGQVGIENAWARASVPGAKVAGGYMTIVNRGDKADKLLGATSPAAARVETHVHIMRGEVAEMREVPGYDIPASGRFELKPGGAHLMLVDLKRPLAPGDKVPVTLRFARAGEIKAELAVGALGAPGPGGHGMKR